MGPVQELSSDVLLLIFCKLAKQDTLALLRARFACKAFLAAAENHPHFWKTAFLSPLKSDDVCDEELEGFETEVEALGGYKQLLAARVASLMHRKNREQSALAGEQSHQKAPQSEQSQGLEKSGMTADPKSDSEPGFTGRALALVRLNGRPVAFEVLNPCEPALEHSSNCSHLRPLVPFQKTRDEMEGHYKMVGRMWARLERLLLDTTLLSLEVFLCSRAGECGEEIVHATFTLKDKLSLRGRGLPLSPKQLAWFTVHLTDTVLQTSDLRSLGRVNVTSGSPRLQLYFEMSAGHTVEWESSDYTSL